MALKKSELYSSLWKSCDELRGGMDASIYKDYVLVLLFVKYVSDREGRRDSLIEVPKGGRFADMVALKGSKNIGDGLNKIIGNLAKVNGLEGVIDVADWNDDDKLGSGQAMVDRLSNLVAIFEGLDFGRNQGEGDDLLGDAYEYLMRNFATESGKSKGQFYTPAEVSRVMAKVVGIDATRGSKPTIFDPTCGSGSLLIKAYDEAPVGLRKNIALYGQEMDVATKALARMNMILHGQSTAEIEQGNSLANPFFRDKSGGLKTFDFVVANPPFSTKAWTNGLALPEDKPFNRFAFGVPPKKNGDYAFLLHILASMKTTGKAAVILPHGVLFRGNAEADIRRALLTRGYIRGIIGLPANLFYGTGIPACILVLDKEHVGTRKGVFMIDASKGFRKDGNKNRLRARDIHRITDTFAKGKDVPGYARMVQLKEIADAKNDFNLNLPRYIDNGEPEDVQDISAHLHGGIPARDVDALGEFWGVFPGVRGALFKRGDRPKYYALKVAPEAIKATIADHAEFRAFAAEASARFNAWAKRSARILKGVKKGDPPKAVAEALAEDMLAAFRGARLVDPYAMYQHFIDYLDETLRDDLYAITADGWKNAVQPRRLITEKKKDGASSIPKEKPSLSLGKVKLKMDVLPPGFVGTYFFAADNEALAALDAVAGEAESVLQGIIEEHGEEGGALWDARNGKGQYTVRSVTAALAEMGDDPEYQEERAVLNAFLDAAVREASAIHECTQRNATLAQKIIERYGRVTEDEVKTLVVDEKWINALRATLAEEMDRVSQTLATRTRQLADRYAEPLPATEKELDRLSKKVAAHLRKMEGQT